MTRSRVTPLYGNCIITAPDGQALCRTSEEKIRWYTDRDLGEIVSRNPTTLKLFFEPKGRNGADHPYTTAEKDNVCVVCGKEDEITRHHVVPRCFRKHFPAERKEHCIHDVLILCVNCHNEYENFALEVKKRIADDMGIPLSRHSQFDKVFSNVRTAASAMLSNGDKIPEPRRTELLDRLRVYFGKQEIAEEDMKFVLKLEPVILDSSLKTFGQTVVESLENINDFVVKWRRHFIEAMKPKYLPAFWSVDHKF